MKIDSGIVRRGTTIAIGAPTVLVLLYFKWTLAVLVWVVTYACMIEWTAMKRHLKVALLDPECTSAFAPSRNVEYKVPLAKTNLFIICKCLACSVIVPMTLIGSADFHCAMTCYFFFWVLFTLMGQNKAESKTSTFMKKLVEPGTPTSRSEGERFALHEMSIISKHYTTDLMLSFALEYFGFVWTSGMCYCVLVYQLHPTRGPALTYAMCCGNWMNDIAALIVGRTLKGRSHALYPRISPNKSIEGAVAGVIANGITVGAIMAIGYPDDVWPFATFPLFCFFGLAAGVLGVIGDLLESLLKRTAKIKDTGALIPGHGGILDRMDGMLLVFPLTYWGLWMYLHHQKMMPLEEVFVLSRMLL